MKTEYVTKKDLAEAFEQNNKILIDQMSNMVASIVDHMDERFSGVDKRFEQVDKRFDKVELRLNRLELKFDKLETKFDVVKDDVENWKEQVARLRRNGSPRAS